MDQLIWQIILGGFLIVGATAIQAWAIGLAAMLRPKIARRLHKLRLSTMTWVIALAALWMLAGMMAGVWVWALAMLGLGAFDAIEPALYFSLTSYTTLGFGDVLPPPEWRIMGAIIGANGMLGFGLATAGLVEFVTQLQADLKD